MKLNSAVKIGQGEMGHRKETVMLLISTYSEVCSDLGHTLSCISGEVKCREISSIAWNRLLTTLSATIDCCYRSNNKVTSDATSFLEQAIAVFGLPYLSVLPAFLPESCSVYILELECPIQGFWAGRSEWF